MRNSALVLVCLLALAGLSRTALAGPYPDYTTISEEMAANPGVVEAATGWYDQNPPLFYQVRLRRLRSEIEKTPAHLTLYHEAAAAAEQAETPEIGRQLLAQMLQELKKLDPSSVKESWVAYYTDAGMLDTEEWLRAGAKSDRTVLLQHAKQLFAKAEALVDTTKLSDPWIDGKLVHWFLNEPIKSDSGVTHARDFTLYKVFMGEDGSETLTYQEDQLGAICKYLTGLIVKDRVWRFREMYDVIELELEGGGNLGEIVHVAGLASPNSPASKPAPESGFRVMRYAAPWYADSLEDMYSTWKAAAEDRRKTRTAYMTPLLEKGRHPDTDRHFWDGYVEPKKPAVIDMNPWQRFRGFMDENVVFFVCGIPILLPILWLVTRNLVWRWQCERHLKRKRLKEAASDR